MQGGRQLQAVLEAAANPFPEGLHHLTPTRDVGGIQCHHFVPQPLWSGCSDIAHGVAVHFPVAHDAEPRLLGSSATCTSSLLKCLFVSFARFLTGGFFSINSRYQSCQERGLQIFLPACSLFSHLLSFFHRAKVFRFSFYGLRFCYHIQEPFPLRSLLQNSVLPEGFLWFWAAFLL